jgi:hypothetical protein
MNTVLLEPVDALHAESVAAVAEIRRQTNEARTRLGLPEVDYQQRGRS